MKDQPRNILIKFEVIPINFVMFDFVMDAVDIDFVVSNAVSYTHLTLPTICSV